MQPSVAPRRMQCVPPSAADSRASHQQTPASSASRILRCLSRPHSAALHPAARRCGGLPLRAGDAAIAREPQPPRGALGAPAGGLAGALA